MQNISLKKKKDTFCTVNVTEREGVAGQRVNVPLTRENVSQATVVQQMDENYDKEMEHKVSHMFSHLDHRRSLLLNSRSIYRSLLTR